MANTSTTAKKKTVRKKKAAKKTAADVTVKTAGTEKAGEQKSAPPKALAPLEAFERVFDDLLQRRWPHPLHLEWPRWGDWSGMLDKSAPSVDVVDRAKEVVVRAEVPGIDKEDLDVSIADRTLTIKGSSRHEEKEEGEDYFRQEIRSGAFSRSVLLPAEVNAGKAKATFKDGVLELHLPKVHASKRQQIALK